jgi:arginine decarboxylase
MSERKKQRRWGVKNAIDYYSIHRWGRDYFSANADGELVCTPTRNKKEAISIMEVIREAKERGLSFPLQVRFQDLLRDRVRRLNESFTEAIAELGYKNGYSGVFPIKVNQLREVVEEIVDAGIPYQFGLEAGSKPELMAALWAHESPESLIICNGYKDIPFIRLALLGQKIGKRVILVVEKFDEIERIIAISRQMKVSPLIGLRVRLQSKSSGKWAQSSGDRAKFGLSSSEILAAIEYLQEHEMLDCLKLLHFHIGSQIPDIISITRATREASRLYVRLKKMGVPLEYLDVGGGLGIDYDGSKSNYHSSINYSLEEYCRNIVYHIMTICDEEKVAHPIIVSESGRAIVAPHTVLLVEAFGRVTKKCDSKFLELGEKEHKLIKELLHVKEELTPDNLDESYHDMIQVREEALRLFDTGQLDLLTKAKVENLYWEICEEVVELSKQGDHVSEDILDLRKTFSDQYLCNFSIFQSLMDNWALKQIFPIVPVHFLNRRPTVPATLADITCDSEGRIDEFVDMKDVKHSLLLHEMTDEPYYLGIFLVGAYQDVMGDQHNLFGRVNEVHVFLDEDEERGFYIEEVIPGSTMTQVLEDTQYDPNTLLRTLKQDISRAIKADLVKPNEGIRLFEEYKAALGDYTYLSDR